MKKHLKIVISVIILVITVSVVGVFGDNMGVFTSVDAKWPIPENQFDSHELNIIQDIIPEGNKNRPGKPNPINYITIHNTANVKNGANAIAHGDYVRNTKDKVSWHYTVDDTNVVHHIPDQETAFHAGDTAKGLGNSQSIGIEICENADGNYSAAEDRAAKLTAYLCHIYNIPLSNIKQHYDWSGKDCPRVIRATPNGWNNFIAKVDKYLGEREAYKKDIADVVDTLAKAGIITNTELWNTKMKTDRDSYWLAKKTAATVTDAYAQLAQMEDENKKLAGKIN